jgi:hypothetical protein
MPAKLRELTVYMELQEVKKLLGDGKEYAPKKVICRKCKCVYQYAEHDIVKVSSADWEVFCPECDESVAINKNTGEIIRCRDNRFNEIMYYSEN